MPRLLTFPVLLCALVACAEQDVPVQDDCPHPPRADQDGDGLTDCEELALGTALRLADTDGDGFSDGQEVIQLGFAPDNNNFKFNPRIADIPQIGVDVSAVPDIELFFTDTEGVERSSSVERSESSLSSVTTRRTSTQSHAVEFGISTGASVTAGAEIGFPKFGTSVETTVSFETSLATTQESSFSFGTDQTLENERGLAVADAEARSLDTTVDGGRLAVTVDVYNAGDIAFTLDSLLLSALMTTPEGTEILRPIGTLDFDSLDGTLPPQTFAPGQRQGPLVFANARLGTGTVRSLLDDASNLDIRIVGYELTNENGQAFTHNQTEVLAKTATVLLDFGPGRPIERYAVATNVDEDRLRIDAREALADILRIPYSINEAGELESVRDLDRNLNTGGFWAVIRKTTDGVEERVDFASPEDPPLDFDAISLQSGDVLHLMYYADRDADGLGEREEAAYGTDPNDPDTDGDRIRDGDEVYLLKTSALDRDTDDDCLEDGEEIEGGTDPLVNSTDLRCPDEGEVQ